MAPTPPNAGKFPAPNSYYVERNLSIDEFVAWATNSPPPGVTHGNPGGGNDTPLRLRSIIGPPGVGKTTFVNRLLDVLEQRPDCVPLNKLDFLDFDHQSLDNKLDIWLIGAVDLGVDRFPSLNDINFSDPAIIGIKYGYFFRHLLQQCGAKSTVLIVVDAYDELTEAERSFLEERVLTAFLFPDDGKFTRLPHIIIVRRDENKLTKPQLRWEEEIHELDGLGAIPNDPAEQIRRRLQANNVASPPNRDAWESDLDERIVLAALDEETRERLVSDLKPVLTPNPYINILLLAQKIHAYLPIPAAGLPVTFNDCLLFYLSRAGLTPDYAAKLFELAALIERVDPQFGTFTHSEYGGSGAQAHDFDEFMNCGVITPASGLRYKLDPSVLQLCRLAA